MSAPVAPICHSATGNRAMARAGQWCDVVAFVAALLLAATGLGGWWGLGRMSGVALSVHSGLGPLFLAALAAGVMLRFAGADAMPGARERGIVAICAWLTHLSALIVGISILIVLSGLAETVTQATLVGVHRVAAIVFIGLFVVTWSARRLSAARPRA